jgi:hypothetical protein
MEEGFESGWRKMKSNGWSARGGTCVSAYNPQRNPLGKSFYLSYFWYLHNGLKIGCMAHIQEVAPEVQ